MPSARPAAAPAHKHGLLLSALVVVLLAGGDKSTQSADIETALRLARNL